MNHLCKCGVISQEFTRGGSNLGDIARQSGFCFLMMTDGTTQWLCQDCYKKVYEHALAIKEILKSDRGHLYFIISRNQLE